MCRGWGWAGEAYSFIHLLTLLIIRQEDSIQTQETRGGNVVFVSIVIFYYSILIWPLCRNDRLTLIMTDHASLSKRSTVPAPNTLVETTSNIWALFFIGMEWGGCRGGRARARSRWVGGLTVRGRFGS